jgi:sugar O-acyltransferase (sialic acid O-acetyltransferase NeuD family)
LKKECLNNIRKSIVIIGGGGFAREVFSLIDRTIYDIAGFIDNDEQNSGLPAPLIGNDSMIHDLKVKGIADYACIAVGNMKVRRRLFELAKTSGLQLPPIMYRNAVWLSTVVPGEGSVIYPGVVVMNDCTIGSGTLLNSGVTLGHDVTIGNFSNINPGAHLAGRVHIGEETMIGIGASVRDSISIGSYVTIGAGSVVVNDIPDSSVAYGVPAKIKQGND